MIKKSSFILLLLLLSVCFTIFFNVHSFAQSDPVEQLLKTGQDHFNLFQYEKALENFKKAADMAPKNWEANFLAGKTLIKLRRLDEAEKYLSKAYSANPMDIDLQKTLGALYINFAKSAQNNGQTTKKNEYQMKACHVYPAATKLWQSLFESWWDSKDYKKIKEEGEFVYKKNQNLLTEGEDVSLQQIMVMVAKVYYSEGDFAKAEAYLNHASKIKVQNEELYGLKRQIKNQETDRVKKILDQAEYEMNKKQFDKALETLKSAYQLSGSSDTGIEKQIEELEKQITINKYLVEINELIKKEDYENAAVKVDEALQTFPNNEELNEKSQTINKVLEEIQEKLDEEERAKNREEELKRKSEMEAFNLKKDAAKFEGEKDYEKAIAALKKALKYTPKDNSINKKIEELQATSKKEKERANYYIKSKDEIDTFLSAQNYEECAQKAEKLLKDYPEHKDTLAVIVTEAYLKLEKYEEAAKASENLKDNKENEDLYNYAQGLYKYNTGASEEAGKFLELVKNSNSKYKSEASKITTWIFLNKVKYGILILLIIVVIVVTPKVKDYLKQSRAYNMAKKLEKIKETGSYEANYDFLKQRFEKEDVDNMKLVTLLYAAALQKKGEYEQSYQLINEYIKKDSRSPLAKSIAGETAMAIGETSPMALEQIQGLLKLNENRKDVVEYLAKAYISLKADHKLAQEYISKYIAFKPNDSEAITYLADVYIGRLNYTAQSIKTFEKAIKANPDKPEYYVALKDNYQSIGNQEEAEKMQAIIDEKFPDYGSAPSQQQAYDPYAYPQDYGQQQYASLASNDESQSQNIVQPEQNTTTEQQSYDQQILQQQMMFQQASKKPSAFPDYDSIGGDDLAGLDAPLDYSNLGNQSLSQNLGQPQVNEQPSQPTPIFQGPKKNCPHCGAVNPANEYYCNSCGKPF